MSFGRHQGLLLAFCAAMALLALPGCMTTAAEAQRQARWAQPIQGAGLNNLYRVDATLWRSAELTDDSAYAAADALGIHTIVNLKPGADNPGQAHAARLVHLPVWTWHVTDAQVLEFLTLAVDPARQPLLVHCRHGSDRTGVMVAAYRMVVQGWTQEGALREMQRGGYGYHPIWINLPHVLERLDVAGLRRQLGLPPVTASLSPTPPGDARAANRPTWPHSAPE